MLLDAGELRLIAQPGVGDQRGDPFERLAGQQGAQPLIGRIQASRQRQ